MAEYDQQMEQRVWNRIRGEEPKSLQALAAAERACAAVYLRLARMSQGNQKAVLRQLFERERQHSRYLNGISLLMADQSLSVRTVPPAADSLAIALRKCYAASLKAAGEYEKRKDDREYGGVFARMAEEEREHCAMILDILGAVRS